MFNAEVKQTLHTDKLMKQNRADRFVSTCTGDTVEGSLFYLTLLFIHLYIYFSSSFIISQVTPDITAILCVKIYHLQPTYCEVKTENWLSRKHLEHICSLNLGLKYNYYNNSSAQNWMTDQTQLVWIISTNCYFHTNEINSAFE